MANRPVVARGSRWQDAGRGRTLCWRETDRLLRWVSRLRRRPHRGLEKTGRDGVPGVMRLAQPARPRTQHRTDPRCGDYRRFNELDEMERVGPLRSRSSGRTAAEIVIDLSTATRSLVAQIDPALAITRDWHLLRIDG